MIQIAGLALNGVLRKGEREECERRLSEVDDVKFKTIFGLLYKLNEKIDLFEKYNIDEIFECRILSVDDEFRGKGLANVLMEDSVETARKAGFKVEQRFCNCRWTCACPLDRFKLRFKTRKFDESIGERC